MAKRSKLTVAVLRVQRLTGTPKEGGGHLATACRHRVVEEEVQCSAAVLACAQFSSAILMFVPLKDG